MTQPALFQRGMETGAMFSPCRLWRYSLWRIWGNGPKCAFIGLNPSTADESQDDPTIRRCIRYAKDWGFDGLVMLNIFAFRATDPRDMKAVADPVGPGNDWMLNHWAGRCDMLVAAWGNHGSHLNRSQLVRPVIGRDLHCLKLTGAGEPIHPLYQKATAKPILFWTPASR